MRSVWLLCLLVLGQHNLRAQPQLHPLADSGPTDSSFTLLGHWAWGPCNAVFANADYVYLGNGPTVQIMDVSDALSPRVVGEYVTGGLIYEIEVHGNLAFVNHGGLLILDVSNPELPTRVSELTNVSGLRMAVDGSFVYLRNDYPGLLYVIDVTNPSAPEVKSSRGVGRKPRDLAGKDGYIYLGDGFFGDVSIIDATDPERPEHIGAFGGAGDALFVRDSLLYSGSATALDVYSIADPSSPIELGRVNVQGEGTVSYIKSITASGADLYLTTLDAEVIHVDVSNPTEPAVLGRIQLPTPRPLDGSDIGPHGSQWAIASQHETVFVASTTGLWLIDGQRSSELMVQTFIPTGGWVENVDLNDQFAFVASGAAGVWVVDVSDPTRPHNVVNISVGGYTEDVVATDSLLFAVNSPRFTDDDTTRGLWIFDIADVRNPSVMGHHVGITRYPNVNGLELFGDYVLITRYGGVNDSTLEVVDVSDPLRPARVSVIRAGSAVRDLAADEQHLFLSTLDGGLKVIDWNDPHSPTEIYRLFDRTAEIGLSESTLYVDRDRWDTLNIVDVSRRDEPIVIGAMRKTVPDDALDLVVSGNRIYWSDGEYLNVGDISNPSEPRQLGLTRVFPRRLAAKGDTIFVAKGFSGVQIIRETFVSGTAIESGHMPSAGNFVLESVYPNPVRDNAVIEFFASTGDRVVLEILDMLGRKVTTLLRDTVPPGRHRVVIDPAGLSTGVYLVRLTTSRESIARKLIVIR